jgi:phytoene synthase
MTCSLETSYRACQRLTRESAHNFYYSFLLLPRGKRRSMCALYAFMRHTDDLGDNDQPVDARRHALDQWQRSLDLALEGRFDSPLLPALADTLAKFRVPPVYLYDVIDGVRMDLNRQRYETFDELADYCYHVASVVGLACIHIWGFQGGEAALVPARASGIALQLTNILRDLREDARAGRVYLPQEDLRRFGYTSEDLLAGVDDARFDALMRFEIARAEDYYRQGAQLAPYLYQDGKRVFGAMTGIYRGLLDEIKLRHGDVFNRRVGLSPWRKLRIAARWMLPRPIWLGAER